LFLIQTRTESFHGFLEMFEYGFHEWLSLVWELGVYKSTFGAGCLLLLIDTCFFLYQKRKKMSDMSAPCPKSTNDDSMSFFSRKDSSTLSWTESWFLKLLSENNDVRALLFDNYGFLSIHVPKQASILYMSTFLQHDNRFRRMDRCLGSGTRIKPPLCNTTLLVTNTHFFFYQNGSLHQLCLRSRKNRRLPGRCFSLFEKWAKVLHGAVFLVLRQL
jgi:hypothetical protein